MSQLQTLRLLVKQRLHEVTEEISALIERAIAENQEEICGFKETKLQHKLLDAAFSPKVEQHGSDVQQQVQINKVVPAEWSPSLDQEDQGDQGDQEPLHIKEEQEELKSFPVTVPVKSDVQETPQSSQLHRSHMEGDGEAELPAEVLTEWSPSLDQEDPEPLHIKEHQEELWSSLEGEQLDGLEEAATKDSDNDAPESAVHAEKYDKASSLINGKWDRVKQKVASQKDRPFGCDVCGKRFTHQRYLRHHMVVHTAEKPFGCDVCGKRFKWRESLSGHMRVHTGEKPFGCDVCGKRFKWRESLSGHMKVHTGEKPFGCDVCGKRTVTKGNLNRHMRVHTGEKPFLCDICGKRLKRRDSLIHHLRVHSGEKPFGCDVCGKRFIVQIRLQRHMRVHTAEKPLGCSI